MSTRNFIFRAEADLHELAKARAKADGINVSDVGRAALREYLTGDDGGEPLRLALLRAEASEAKCKRLEKALAACRRGVVVMDVATAKQARAGERKDRDGRLVSALEAATAEDPATAPRLADLSGYAVLWCRDLLRALGEAGYLEKVTPGRMEKAGPQQWVPVPGRDMSEGVKAAKALAQRGPARITRKRGRPEAAPDVAPVVFKPAAVKP